MILQFRVTNGTNKPIVVKCYHKTKNIFREPIYELSELFYYEINLDRSDKEILSVVSSDFRDDIHEMILMVRREEGIKLLEI